ncbi:MAG: FHA domain-containing protein [Deltaproteobacteria bacterium]|nr:FHA domain-containing protein [Deltaproteobacteria bacterium]MCB9785938.1 FHA domain-containing protein [Deltaproteobacteria bacterium]
MRHLTAPSTPSRLVSLVAWTLAMAASTVALANVKIDVDYIDGQDFVPKGTIRIYADLVDDEYNVISGLSGDKVTVFIDDKEVPGTIEVETAEKAKEWVAVAILMAAHRSYASWSGAELGEGGEPEPDAFKLEEQGFANFIRRLSGNDRVAVWTYDEKALRPVEAWTENHRQAAEDVETKARPPADDGSKQDVIAPDLYKYLKDIVEKIGSAENLPRRRILLVMSDGKDKKGRKAEKLIEPIVEAARTNGVRLYAIGFSLDVTEYLVTLQQLAGATGGVYREIKDDQMDSIPQVLENIAVELKKQYVLTFHPTEDYTGSDKSVKIRVKVEAPGGELVEDEYAEPVKIGEKAFDWKTLLIWVGVGLGSLLGLFLIFKLIGGIIRARRANANAPVVEEDYAGPYKGKLTAIAGPHVGMEFYLVEDVTTIGSIAGNSIVLHDSGVSKRHAGIKVEEMRFELADFGSTNGTLVNGTKITKQFLRDGDEIRLGETVLRFALK